MYSIIINIKLYFTNFTFFEVVDFFILIRSFEISFEFTDLDEAFLNSSSVIKPSLVVFLKYQDYHRQK